jgi:hypothetical protein
MDQNEPSLTGPVGPELLGQVFDRHAAALVFYARQWCPNPEDVVQEALILLAAEPRAPRDVVSWLYHVVRVPVGDGAIYSSGRDAPAIRDITDGASNTILAVEVDDGHAVPWTKPEDLPFDPQRPEKGLGGTYPGGFLALFADASASPIELPGDPQHLRALFTRAGGEVVLHR